MNRHELETLYTLNDPATSQAIKMLPPEWHMLYPSYLHFLELSNGLFGDEITLLEAEDIQQRNIDGMGVMSEDALEKISSSLEDFLLVKKGMFNY